MELAMSKTREQFPLSEKKPLKKTLPCIINCIVLFILLLVGYLTFAPLTYRYFSSNSVLATSLFAAILFAVICFLVYQYQVWYFKVYFYDLNDDFIVIRKGVFTPCEISIPYERVQDIYVDQDLLDRIMGLYDVHLSSATISSGVEAHIDGVEKAAADGLRKVILDKVSEKIKKKNN